jgi:Tol biopolymer transport system component
MKYAAAAFAIAWVLLSAHPVLAEAGRLRIFIADADGRNAKLLVEIPEAAYHGSPHWSSDGKLILINAMTEPRAFNLSRIYACAVGGPFNGNVVELGVGAAARFSPDMTRIAFHVRAGNPEQLEPGVWVMRDDGSERTRLCDGTRPRWTPDGKRLVFLSEHVNGVNMEMISADGNGRRSIINEVYPSIAGTSISPDGKEVCFIAYPQQAYDGILFRMPLPDPEKPEKPPAPRDIHRGKIGWDPAWSPDGRSILFWTIDENSNRRLVTIDAGGGQEPKLLADQDGVHYATDAEWSPDSKRIIFASDRPVPPK